MARAYTVVMGVFDEIGDAERALRDLSAMGVPQEEIAILAHPLALHEEHRRAAEPHGSSVVAGGATMAATLIGIVLFAIPLAGLLVAGPLAVFGGAAAVKPTHAGSPDALTDLGVDRHDAKLAVESVRRGGIAVVVRPDDALTRRTIEVLARAGAIDLVRREAEWEARGWTFEPNGVPWTRAQIHAERARLRAEREAAAQVVIADAGAVQRATPAPP